MQCVCSTVLFAIAFPLAADGIVESLVGAGMRRLARAALSGLFVLVVATLAVVDGGTVAIAVPPGTAPDGPTLVRRVNACENRHDLQRPQYFKDFGFDDSLWAVVGLANLRSGQRALLRCDAVRHMLDGTARDNTKIHDPRTAPEAFVRCMEKIIKHASSARIDVATGNQRFLYLYAPGKEATMWVAGQNRTGFREIRTVYTNSQTDDWVGCAAGVAR